MSTKEELAERRERWAAALESGQYAQTRERLHDSRGYCCLGVACDLYAQEKGLEWTPMPRRGGTEYVLTIGEERAISLLIEPVMEWLGLREPGGEYAGNGLANQNDHGVPFKEIAAIIRAGPEGLFSDD